ncbi:MAG: reverse transcriptase domain-containing protein, partial [bacterium]
MSIYILLLYADDLVLMAHSPEDLQVLLDVLHRFAVANHLTVNTQKSKVLACG